MKSTINIHSAVVSFLKKDTEKIFKIYSKHIISRLFIEKNVKFYTLNFFKRIVSMPQKKTAKRTKTKKSTTKPQMQRSILALAEKVEKEFRQLPTKLSKLYRQELMAQKQIESKLKTDIKKTVEQQKAALKKQSILMKGKVGKATKKQLATTKKSIDQATKTIKAHTLKLTQVAKTSEMLSTKQKKYASLNKGLAQIEKQLLAESAVKTNKTKKPTANKLTPKKAKAVKQTPKQSPKEVVITEETPFMISSKTEIVEA